MATKLKEKWLEIVVAVVIAIASLIGSVMGYQLQQGLNAVSENQKRIGDHETRIVYIERTAPSQQERLEIQRLLTQLSVNVVNLTEQVNELKQEMRER